MAGVAEVDKTTGRERGAELKSALAWLMIFALVTCRSSVLFGQRLSHVQGVTFDTSAGVWSATASGRAVSSLSITPSRPNELLYGGADLPELSPPTGSAGAMTGPEAGAAPGVWTGSAGGIPPLTGYESGGATEYDLNSSGPTAENFTDKCPGVNPKNLCCLPPTKTARHCSQNHFLDFHRSLSGGV